LVALSWPIVLLGSCPVIASGEIGAANGAGEQYVGDDRWTLPCTVHMLRCTEVSRNRTQWVNRFTLRCPSHVGFPPDRDQIADVSALRFRARSEKGQPTKFEDRN
jgi:hypothetical protein